MFIRILYFLLTTFLSPIIFFKLLWKLKKNRIFFSEMLTRFFGILRKVDGIEAYRISKKRIWIHAVSVGETHAAIPLMRELILRNSECKILLSNSTMTGFDFFNSITLKDKIFKDRVIHCFSPMDFFWSIKLFLNSTNPHIAIFIETEIWPNTINELNARGIKIVLANGRLSKNSLEKFNKFSWLSKPTINKFSLILAQSESDAKRFLEVSTKVEVTVTGNIKFDSPVPNELVNQGLEWRKLFEKKSFWLASSTRNEEESKIFEAWKKNKPSGALLIVVPRHPERFDWVVEQAKKMDFLVVRRSDLLNHAINPDVFLNADVFVGDSLGEIVAYASFSDLALVGGSVIDCGGQSPIELCSQGCPVFFGPYMSNFSRISQQLNLTNAGFEINSYEEWIDDGLKLLSNRNIFVDSKQAANRFVSNNKGASGLTAKKIAKLF